MKTQLEKKLEKEKKELQKYSNFLLNENEEKRERLTKLIFKEKQLHDLKNQIIDEYFKDKEHKRQQEKNIFEKEKYKSAMNVELVKSGNNIMDFILKALTFKNEK